MHVIAKRSGSHTPNYSRRAVKNGYLIGRANDVEAFNVKHWSRESIRILMSNMVMGDLIHKDFSTQIQDYGDTVNTRKPAEFTTIRKTADDDVTIQNATATNVPVKLNQLIHVSYLIRDGQETTSFESLVDTFLEPAMISEAEFVDSVLTGQAYQFLANSGGRLATMDSSNAKSYLLETRKVMNNNRAFSQRNLIVGTDAESTLLDVAAFTDADKRGDNGEAQANAVLGRKFGFNINMCQNAPYVTSMASLVTGAINNAAGYGAGTTSLTVDGLSAAITAGTYFTVAGDNTPQQVVSTTGGSTPTAIVCTPGLKRSVADNAVITLYPVSATTAAYSYDATTNTGYSKGIAITAFSGNTPQVGQLVSFGSSTIKYAITRVASTTEIWLDRPIEASISSGDKVNLGPNGGYNLAFHRNALTMVSRPLALPRASTGVVADVMNWKGMSLRVTVTYDGVKQGHLVTMDALFGIKVLDTDLGAVLLS